jgi:mannose-6-phosphate isomerase-like protein (cupin superfamily)
MLNDEMPRSPCVGAMVAVKASTEQTGGAFNLFDALCPVGYETPLHIHYVEDVVMYVLQGTLEVFWGNEKYLALVGSYFYQPKGTPHGFRVVGNSQARFLYWTTPAGFDHLVSDCIRSANDFGVISAAQYKIEILGPLPDEELQKKDQTD